VRGHAHRAARAACGLWSSRRRVAARVDLEGRRAPCWRRGRGGAATSSAAASTAARRGPPAATSTAAVCRQAPRPLLVVQLIAAAPTCRRCGRAGSWHPGRRAAPAWVCSGRCVRAASRVMAVRGREASSTGACPGAGCWACSSSRRRRPAASGTGRARWWTSSPPAGEAGCNPLAALLAAHKGSCCRGMASLARMRTAGGPVQGRRGSTASSHWQAVPQLGAASFQRPCRSGESYRLKESRERAEKKQQSRRSQRKKSSSA
jgi:hypothetical protein